MEYSEWLANVVLVKKANGKWRLCIDFTDINKVCPKDSFPLPRIDLIVDATASHELLSFMDAFSGYNQISMDPDDQEKTSFVTAQGTYYYRGMPFGLKNAGVKCEEAFAALKTYLSSRPILVSPIEGELLTLYLAVSDFSTSAVLVRDKERVQHPVYYCSRALRGAEERYPRMKKLILALVTAARKLLPCFQAHTIEIPTEYPMKQVLHKPETSGRLMKWAIELRELDIWYKPKTTIKGQVLADFIMEFISAEPAENAQTETNLSIWKLSVDGASNAQGSGAGLILTSPEGIDIEYALRFGFHASNNEAEYKAVIAGLNLAYSLEADQLEVCSDSQLVVRQIEDTYEAKSGRMILYLHKVRELLKKFVLVQVRHVPRAGNSRADALAKLATALYEDISKTTPVEYLAEPSIDLCDVQVAQIRSESSWMEPIWDYIIDGRLPDDPKEAAKIRTRSARFTNHKGSLYKRGFFTPILKCIAGKDTEYVLREVHEGIYGNHIGAWALAGKVLRHGYYWPTILKDATYLVKRCKICQEHARISRLPSEPLTSITSP